MNDKIKVGIAGLGSHAIQPHLAQLLKFEEVEIVGAYDPDISKFDQANKILGTNLKFFNSYQELCFASDAVIICSPDSVHFSQLMIAVKEYGCHVLVENPILTDKSQINEFEELLRTTNKVITTCLPRRFDAMYVYAKKMVDKYKQEYGRVESFGMYCEFQVPSENELCNCKNSLMSDRFCHELDYMNYILGLKKIKIDRYSDGYDHYWVDGRIKDAGDNYVGFEFKADGILEAGAPSHEWLYITLKHAVIRIDNLYPINSWAQYRMQSVDHYGDVTGERLILIDYLCAPKNDLNARYEALNRNFIDSILGKEKPYLSKKEIFLAAIMPLDYVSK